MRLRCTVVDEIPGLKIADADHQALRQIVSWERLPSFARPGRTAWYVLSEPVVDPRTSRPLLAAKIKGVGAWQPPDPATPQTSDAAELGHLSPPSTSPFEETARDPHFGLDGNGNFARVFSEPAPYGAITLPRAQREFDNAATLYRAGVPAIVPLAVYRYDDVGTFSGHPLGAVVSLTWDESPYSLDLLRVENPAATTEERAYAASVREMLGYPSGKPDGASTLAVRAWVGRQIGVRLRELAQAGLYRYSAGWDNFFLDRASRTVYLTDLDSTREFAELPEQVQGIQVLRDLAGTLYSFVNKIYHPSTLDDYDLGVLLDLDPLAAVLAGYFEIDEDHARRLTQPLWQYFMPHWFLLKRHRKQLRGWPQEHRQGYKMDPMLFYALAILALSEVYRDVGKSLRLPLLPPDADLRQRMRGFLRENVDFIEFLLRSTRPA